MAITSADIHNQSFSIDRKGYDVDEVDVFLERVADEIDGLNAQISQLEEQLNDSKFDGFDTPARIDDIDDEAVAAPAAETAVFAPVAAATAVAVAVDDDLLAQKDARIAELEEALNSKKADDNAIAQALISAQRSADDTISNANARSAAIIKDAEDEAARILDKADADKQKVVDAIKKLEDDREDARDEYVDLLSDFITDASRKLNEVGAPVPHIAASAHARFEGGSESTGALTASQPYAFESGAGAYSAPQATGAVAAAAAAVVPSVIEKDLSGFGDADDDFEFDEID